MKRRLLFKTLLLALTTGAGYWLGRQRPDAHAGPLSATDAGMVGGNGMMGRGMMGGGMGGMMSPENMRGPMRTGMALFMHHAEIRRTITDIPGGVRAETMSGNPKPSH
jgi:hypothetical protein